MSAPARAVESISGWKKIFINQVNESCCTWNTCKCLANLSKGWNHTISQKENCWEICSGRNMSRLISTFAQFLWFMQQCICDVWVFPLYIHDIQGKTVNVVCLSDQISWVVRKQEFKKKMSLLKITVFSWNIS